VSKYKNDKIKKMVFMNLACVAGQLGTTNWDRDHRQRKQALE
jgi:hypothetical protein